MENSSFQTPFLNVNGSSTRYAPSSFYPTSSRSRATPSGNGDSEKLDVILSQLSEQRQPLINQQEQNGTVLDVVQQLSSTVCQLREDFQSLKEEVKALKTGDKTNKPKQVPRSISVRQYLDV